MNRLAFLSFTALLTLGVSGGCRSSSASTHPHAVLDGRRVTLADGTDEILPALRASRQAHGLPDAAVRETAPDLSGGVAWLNTDRPLRLPELRGHVVLVDFWTYCCINCMHALPVLGRLEERHRNDPVVVIGVHSAKFPGEREADRIAEAITRYGIHHPVVVDSENAIWNRWDVHGWPSVFVIDTHGRVVGTLSGEPTLERLDQIVGELLDEGRADGSLAHDRVAIRAPAVRDTGALAYPGKVISLGGDRIAFSDSGHHRIVIGRTNGNVEHVIGAGIPGRSDGDFEHATFRRPQGLAAEPPTNGGQPVNVLYVADTENHEIRRVEIAEQRVTTLAGVGELGTGRGDEAMRGRDAHLRSPWDLARHDDHLYIAMAGSHQIWRMTLDGATIEPWLGSGQEARVDGSGRNAAFAQPSGLAVAGQTLFVADSETSSIRAVDFTTRAVRTLVGQDLFVFGDQDGVGDRVRLQHPLGVATIPGEDGRVYVADTYNHRIRQLEVAQRRTRAIAGAPSRDPFFEPSGLAWAGTEFVVADTNHHRIARMSRDGRTVTAIPWDGLRAPTAQVADTSVTAR